MKKVIFLAATLALCSAAATAATITVDPAAFEQFAQAGTAPAPAAIGGPVGSPTYVMPPSNSVVDVGQAFGVFAPYINSTLGLLIYAGLMWVGRKFDKKLDTDTDANFRDALHTYAERMANSLVADGAVKLNGLQVDVHQPALAAAANGAIAAVPGALKRFGITPDKVESIVGDMIEDYVHRVPAVAAAAVGPAPTAKA